FKPVYFLSYHPHTPLRSQGKGIIAASLAGRSFYPSAAYATLNANVDVGRINIAGPGKAPLDDYTAHVDCMYAACKKELLYATSTLYSKRERGSHPSLLPCTQQHTPTSLPKVVERWNGASVRPVAHSPPFSYSHTHLHLPLSPSGYRVGATEMRYGDYMTATVDEEGNAWAAVQGGKGTGGTGTMGGMGVMGTTGGMGMTREMGTMRGMGITGGMGTTGGMGITRGMGITGEMGMTGGMAGMGGVRRVVGGEGEQGWTRRATHGQQWRGIPGLRGGQHMGTCVSLHEGGGDSMGMGVKRGIKWDMGTRRELGRRMH
ncbi:unnamed protein product, partial [Closterium sp. NIES-54]